MLDIIRNKVRNNERINEDECRYLFYNVDLGKLMIMASEIRNRYNGNNVYYIKNIHIEPTNICENKCRFCSYSSGISGNYWSYSIEEIIDKLKDNIEDVLEVHITGGVNKSYDLNYYSRLFKEIKLLKNDVHIKALTAEELDFICRNSNENIEKVLNTLVISGLDSVAGGGAEIFNENVRKQICKDKITGERWLEIHKIIHRLGIKSNATMMYGHIESIEDIIEHLKLLRELQDETGGFMSFIPLKFRNKNNLLGGISESSLYEDMRVMCISRIYLDNINHIKVYWPNYGKDNILFFVECGADDIDGSVCGTRIYSMAGVKDASVSLSKDEIYCIFEGTKYNVKERNSIYQEIASLTLSEC